MRYEPGIRIADEWVVRCETWIGIAEKRVVRYENRFHIAVVDRS